MRQLRLFLLRLFLLYHTFVSFELAVIMSSDEQSQRKVLQQKESKCDDCVFSTLMYLKFQISLAGELSNVEGPPTDRLCALSKSQQADNHIFLILSTIFSPICTNHFR